MIGVDECDISGASISVNSHSVVDVNLNQKCLVNMQYISQQSCSGRCAIDWTSSETRIQKLIVIRMKMGKKEEGGGHPARICGSEIVNKDASSRQRISIDHSLRTT